MNSRLTPKTQYKPTCMMIVTIMAIVLVGACLALSPFGASEQEFWGRPLLVGVNLPSATFAEQKLPGEAGVDYFYPDKKDIDYFIDNGMNTIRLGFNWERLQPALNKPFDRDEAQRLDDAVQAIIKRGAMAILDLHNYARYRKKIVGSTSVPAETFADFWERLATIYGRNHTVIFGLMNEPHDIEASQWQQTAQIAIARIRQTGASNLILVSSSRWDSASNFVADGDVWKRLTDPADNFAFEVHQYVDIDNTGTHPECLNPLVGVAALHSVTQWMQQNRRRAFLGEFGASKRKECLTALSYMLKFMHHRPDVWLGWTYFAGGRGWSDNDILSIQPVAKVERPQMQLLKEYLH